MPAPVWSLLTSGSTATNATSFTTASVTLTAGRTYLLAITTDGVLSSDRQVPTGVSHAAGSFTLVDSQNVDSFVTQSLWRLTPATTQTGQVTISHTLTQDIEAWALLEWTGNDTTTPVGTAGKSTGTASTTSSVTAVAAVSAEPARLAIHSWVQDTTGTAATGTEAAGWTEVADLPQNESGFSVSMQVQARSSDAASASVTWSSASTAHGSMVFEVRSVPPSGWNTTGTGPRVTPDQGHGAFAAGAFGTFTQGTYSPGGGGSPYSAEITPATYTTTATAATALLGRLADVTPASYATTPASVAALLGQLASVSPAAYTTAASQITGIVGRIGDITPASYSTTYSTVEAIYAGSLAAYLAEITPAAFTTTAASIEGLFLRRAEVQPAAFATTPAAVTALAGFLGDVAPAGYTTTPAAITAAPGRLAAITPAAYSATASQVGAARTALADVSITAYASTFSLITVDYSGLPPPAAADGLAALLRRRRR